MIISIQFEFAWNVHCIFSYQINNAVILNWYSLTLGLRISTHKYVYEFYTPDHIVCFLFFSELHSDTSSQSKVQLILLTYFKPFVDKNFLAGNFTRDIYIFRIRQKYLVKISLLLRSTQTNDNLNYNYMWSLFIYCLGLYIYLPLPIIITLRWIWQKFSSTTISHVSI